MQDEPLSLAPELIEATLLVAEKLDRAQLRYALIGGIAAGFRTHSRSTRDADFLLQIPQIALPGLLSQLEQVGFTFELQSTIRQWTQEHMTVLSYKGIRIDWLKPLIPMYQHVIDRATTENWVGRSIKVASVEGLLLLKVAAFRLQDQLDIESLVAVHGDKLDLDWVRTEWQTIAPLEDLRFEWFMAKLSSRK
jgi:hypothetical protein